MTKVRNSSGENSPKQRPGFFNVSDWPEYTLLGIGVIVVGAISFDTAMHPASARRSVDFSDVATKHLQFLSEGEHGKAQGQYCTKEKELQFSTVKSFDLVSQSGIEEAQGFVYAVDTPDIDQESVIIEVWRSNAFFDYAVTSDSLQTDASAQRSQYSYSDFCINIPSDQFKG